MLWHTWFLCYSMSIWECTYSNDWGSETRKTCYTSCCEHDCCDESSTTSYALILGITIPTGIILIFLLICCRIWIRRRALTRRTVVTVPTSGVIATRTNVTGTTGARAGAPVPQHQGYDQPGFHLSTMSMAAQFEPPPPYSEEPPKATV